MDFVKTFTLLLSFGQEFTAKNWILVKSNALFNRLGEFYDRYFLTSNWYISERMIAKIDEVTDSMAEHGFYQFYHSIMEFKQKYIGQKFSRAIGTNENEINDLRPIIIEQLRKPIIIALGLNAIAVIIFVAEILVFKWLQWRDCKHWRKWRLTLCSCQF